MAKRDVFKWAPSGDKGRFRFIRKEDLNIDGAYQRNEVSKAKVLQIAREWNWLLLGCVLVIERDDESLWVFDGGHRTRASFYRDDVEELPCMVYRMSELSDEAKAFVARNTMVSNVNSIDRYRAAVCAGEPIALQVQEMVVEFGVTVCDGAATKNQIACISTLCRMVERDAELAKQVIAFMLERTVDKPVAGTVARGLFALCLRMKPRMDFLGQNGDKLARHSQREMEIKIRQMRAECGKGGERIEALALLDLVNKGKRQKIQW